MSGYLRTAMDFGRATTGAPWTRPGWRPAKEKAEGGQALVEFALVLPILMLLIIGIIKGGLLFNNYLQLTDSVRTGARVLAIERGQGAPCGAAANEVVSAAGGLDGSKISMSMTEFPEGPLTRRTSSIRPRTRLLRQTRVHSLLSLVVL